MRARLLPFILAGAIGALSPALAQDAQPAPDEQQFLETVPADEVPPAPEGVVPDEVGSTEDAAAVLEIAPNPNPLAGLKLEGLSATLTAPLFTPSRTGPLVEAPVEPVAEEPPPPEVPPEQPPPPLQLVGIVMSDATKTALLKDPGTNEVHRLNSGDEYEGWSVTVVDARSIEFRSGDRVQGLKMFESFPTPANYAVPDDPSLMQGDQPPVEDPALLEQPPPDQQLPAGPELEGVPPDAMQPDGAAPEAAIPPEPPQNFDPQTGDILIPEEGPLDADGDPNTPN
jgi:hypothetical protein